MNLDPEARWAAGAAGVAVAGLSALSAVPGLAALDAGDFATASTTLGVPHATGFPVFTQLGHAAALIPIGNLAGRIGLVSAALSGVAAALVTAVVASAFALRASAWGIAAAVTGAFLTTDTLLLHARVPEVYALNLALVTGCVAALAALRASGDARWRAIAAALIGLGLANHALFRLWGPVLAACAVWWTPRPARRVGLAASAALGACACAAYALLPAAAARGPEHAWGDPQTLTAFWAHVTAADIRAAYAGEMSPTWLTLRVWSARFGAQLFAGLGVLVVFAPLSLLALPRLGRPQRAVIALITALVAVETAYVVVLNPMGLRDAQCGQLTAVVTGALGAAGAGWVLEAARASVRGWAVRLASVFVGAAALQAGSGPSIRETGIDWSAEDLALIHAGLAAPESITVAASDTTIAALLYADVALDARPDAVILGAHVFSDDRALAQALPHQPFPLLPTPVMGTSRGRAAGHIAALLSEHVPARAVYWEVSGEGDGLPPGFAHELRWPLGRVVVEGAPRDECAPPQYSLCPPHIEAEFASAARRSAGARGRFYREWIARRQGYLGARAFRLRRFDEAGAAFERAVGIAPWIPQWHTGLAVALANTGRLEDALAVQDEALRLDPLSVRALSNAIEFADALGARDRAQQLRARRAAVQPE